MSIPASKIASEVARRRTFAIISHPDAGKTTMTEKLLLYGGAIHQAGSVKARKAARYATSDWMAIEKERGISVSSSVMQFEYEGKVVNILDTPGHQDFSEDTYRTLTAADCAVMLLDGAKGVEAQTIKLFQVCRLRRIPIFTFINKMDRAALPPEELMDQLEKVLGIFAVPMNWPIGTHGDFKGIYNRQTSQLELFGEKGGHHGAKRVTASLTSLDDPDLDRLIGSEADVRQLREDVELLSIAGEPFDQERIAVGELTPMYFGSALTNFGVETFLNSFLELAPPPSSRETEQGEISATNPMFSGFVFKIQANMNPQHRDRLSFIRIVSGAYEKDMEVRLVREDKMIKLTQPQQFLAQDHKIVEEAYAGDIIGVFDPGLLRISDTLVAGKEELVFSDIPVFPPEHFAMVAAKDSMKRKQFLKGMQQLAQEGTIQMYKRPDIGTETFVVGVVGVLQLDVLENRLKNEYNVEIRMQNLNYRFARWVHLTDKAVVTAEDFDNLTLTSTTLRVLDHHEQPVLLFESDWAINWALERNPKLRLLEIND